MSKELNKFAGAVDGHAHVFTCQLPMAAARRYTPAADAPPADYTALLSANQLAGGILVQPSFLGTDNRYLLQVLKQARSAAGAARLRGVCVLTPDADAVEIQRLSAAGIIGARLNLLGIQTPPLRSARWRRFMSDVSSAGWHLEVCAEGERLGGIIEDILPHCGSVVVDHFGLPAPDAPLKCPGFRALLRADAPGLRVKISAPYRVFPDLPLAAAATRCTELARALRAELGARRLLWGSDWPWTRHEEKMTFAAALRWREQWLEGEQDGAADLIADAGSAI